MQVAGFSVASYRRAEIDGLRLYYCEAGSGDPVILLHGFPETSFAWRKVVPALAERYTVIAPDLPGSGASDRTVRAAVTTNAPSPRTFAN